MEYGMSPELAEFRTEVRAFIAEHAPAIPPRAGVRSAENDAEFKALQEWTGRLYEAGYVGADWPAGIRGPRRPLTRTLDHRRRRSSLARRLPARRAVACWRRTR